MWTSAGQGDGSPIPFYEHYGFERTGDIIFGNEQGDQRTHQRVVHLQEVVRRFRPRCGREGYRKVVSLVPNKRTRHKLSVLQNLGR